MGTANVSFQARGKAGWMLQLSCLFLGLCINTATFAMIKAMGVFFIQLQLAFEATAAQASFTVSLPSTVVFMGGPVYAAIFTSIGIRKTYAVSPVLMFMGFGACFFAPSLLFVQVFVAIAGAGAGMANVANLTIMGRAFYTSRPMALAALAMGGAAAGAAVTPVMQFCIDTYTWRGAMCILGAYCLNGMALGFALESKYTAIVEMRRNALISRVLHDDNKNIPLSGHNVKDNADVESNCSFPHQIDDEDSSNLPVHDQSVSLEKQKMTRRRSSIYDRFSVLGSNMASAFDLSLLRDPLFVVYCVSCGCSICSRLLSGLYLVRYSQYVGLTDKEAAVKLTICEMVALCFMPLVALFTSVKSETSRRTESRVLRLVRCALSSIKNAYVLGASQLLMAVVMAMSTTLKTNSQLAIYAALLGLCYGGTSFLTNAVLADLFGTQRLPGALGYRSLSSGILFLTTPLIIGYLIDLTGTYDIAQYFLSAMALAAGILTIVTQKAMLRRQKRGVSAECEGRLKT